MQVVLHTTWPHKVIDKAMACQRLAGLQRKLT
jgi:hypothetical protein